MEFDFQQVSMTAGIINFPDWAFSALPVPPSQIEDTKIIKGNSTGGSVSITGSVGTNQ